MKILLTGVNRSGKTTLLTKLLEGIENKRGMVAVGVLQDGERIGFDLQDDSGRTAILARTDQPTDTAVGRYFVDTASFDTFIEPLSKYAPNQLLYIDEIGQMQLYSEKFQKLVQLYLNAPNDYLGTISSIYEHSFINEVKSRSDILLCVITPENRDVMFVALNSALRHRTIFDGFPADTQAKILSLARSYTETASYTSLNKLFNNAIVYVAENRIKQTSPSGFVVRGNHDERHVNIKEEAYSCDCDLFNGRGQFVGQAGECSHIQAVKILK